MKKTTIMLPPVVLREASAHARGQGLSLAALVRRLLDAELGGSRSRPRRASDPIFHRHAYDGKAPRDGAANHDRYLYDQP